MSRILFVILVATVISVFVSPGEVKNKKFIYQNYQVKQAKSILEIVQDEIIKQSKLSNFNYRVALKVANCESGFDPQAKNPSSTAKGVYEFVNKTWKAYCTGDVYDYEKNISCYLKLYPKYPQWWVCQ